MQTGQAWDFDPPVATDNCATPVVQVLNTVTNVSGNSIVATRTWVAIDPCGNSANCQQTITAPAAEAPPILRIQWAGPATLMVSWSALATGYQLETSDSLTSGNWSLSALAPIQTNGLNAVLFTPAAHQKFYRLHKP